MRADDLAILKINTTELSRHQISIYFWDLSMQISSFLFSVGFWSFSFSFSFSSLAMFIFPRKSASKTSTTDDYNIRDIESYDIAIFVVQSLEYTKFFRIREFFCKSFVEVRRPIAHRCPLVRRRCEVLKHVSRKFIVSVII